MGLYSFLGILDAMMVQKNCLETKTKLGKLDLCFVLRAAASSQQRHEDVTRTPGRNYAGHAESCNLIFLPHPPPHVNMEKGETPEMKPEADLRSDVKQGVCRKNNQKLDVPSESFCAERERHLAGRKPGGRRTAAGRPPRPPGCRRTPGA